MGLPKILLPSIVGVTVYIIVNRLFPEKVKEAPLKNLRGGGKRDLVKANLVREIVKKILKDKALKIAILSIFATAGIQHFQSEIETLS